VHLVTALTLALALALPPAERPRRGDGPEPRPAAPAAKPERGPAAYPPTARMAKAPPPPLAEPALGDSAPFTDLGTWVTRASNWPHHYAKTSVWNADESLAMTNDGRILDGATYRQLRTIRVPDEHRTWSNTDPRYVYGVNASRRQWVRVDATTGASTVLATYPGYRSVSYGLHEGNMDNADTGAVLVGDGKLPFLVDPKTGAVRCKVTAGGGFGREVSDATMTQDGSALLVNWRGYGVAAYDAATCGFTRRLTKRNSHYDACVSSAGEQVVVQPVDGRTLGMTRVSDGARTTVYADSALRLHVSCRNVRRPGWAYLSHENTTCDRTLTGMASFGRVWAVKLDGSRDVEIYAWDHQACPARYRDNPMAVPSPTGDRVWFKARWDGRSAGVHGFVAEVRRPDRVGHVDLP
jgi:hypothetical protein